MDPRQGREDVLLGEGSDLTAEPAPIRRVTIRDVARLSGSSISTVSAAFSGSARVADETRRKIYAAANRLGWRPDRRASKLRRNDTALVGVVWELDQSFQSALIDAFYLASRSHNLELFLAGSTRNNSELNAVRLLLAERCTAVVLMGSGLEDQQFSELARQVPTLSFGRAVDAGGADVILGDPKQGMNQAVSHLHDLGHRRILHADGAGMPLSVLRETGYRNAMEKAGLGQYARTVPGGDTVMAGIRLADLLLKLPQLPTSVITYNDMSANGLVRRLEQVGVRVPQDISVIGFDDAPIAADPITPLTTIAQPVQEMADRALAILSDRMDSGVLVSPGREIVELLPTKLVARNTTGPARS